MLTEGENDVQNPPWGGGIGGDDRTVMWGRDMTMKWSRVEGLASFRPSCAPEVGPGRLASRPPGV